MARMMHVQSPRPLHYILEGFFGFCDGEAEADEMAEMAAMREINMHITSETGIEIYPGAGGRIFVSNLFDSSFYTDGQIFKYEFEGGVEDLSICLKNRTTQTFVVSYLTYEIVSLQGGLAAGAGLAALYIYIYDAWNWVGCPTGNARTPRG